jgi:hypothetical protein
MANNKRVSEETFGVDPSSHKVVGGKIVTFGHTVKDGAAIPDRGTSVNVKTGYPAKPVK